MTEIDNRASTKQCGIHPAVVNGAGLMLVGVMLLLDQLGILEVAFWALIFSVFGVVKIVQPSSFAGRLWGFFLLAIGVVIELEHLGYARLRLDRTWPVFVIIAGLILILRAYSQSTPEGDTALSPHLNVFSVLGGGEYRIRTKNLRGGDIVAFMGGFDIDLREADIEGSQATISVSALMGGGVIRVPETWGVSMRVTAFMGGHALKTRESSQPQKTLIVKGIALMGGVEVRN
jgi:hypothetical protein